MQAVLHDHWPEFVIEAVGVALFMLSACAFGTLLGHPDSPVVRSLPDVFIRRLLMGCAMGLTALGLICSPWGQRSGAHFNPATTLTFWRLGKISTVDAAGYAVSQTLGGLAGIAIAVILLGGWLAHPSVRYVATVPGPAGSAAAFVAESGITFVLMAVVLIMTNTASLNRFTPVVVGLLLAAYITLESPISGMSMNPARSLASAIPAAAWVPLWIYFVAPPLGMLAAAEVYVRRHGAARVYCAKLHHDNDQRCIFRCRYAELTPDRAPVPAMRPQPAASGTPPRGAMS